MNNKETKTSFSTRLRTTLSTRVLAEIVKDLQKKYDNILLCVRPQKSGFGTAITDGFKIFLSLKTSPQFIVTMDADYSHNPKAIASSPPSIFCIFPFLTWSITGVLHLPSGGFI